MEQDVERMRRKGAGEKKMMHKIVSEHPDTHQMRAHLKNAISENNRMIENVRRKAVGAHGVDENNVRVLKGVGQAL